MNAPTTTPKDMVIRRTHVAFERYHADAIHLPCEGCGDPLGWAKEDNGFTKITVQFYDGSEPEAAGWYSIFYYCHPACFGKVVTELYDNQEAEIEGRLQD